MKCRVRVGSRGLLKVCSKPCAFFSCWLPFLEQANQEDESVGVVEVGRAYLFFLETRSVSPACPVLGRVMAGLGVEQPLGCLPSLSPALGHLYGWGHRRW